MSKSKKLFTVVSVKLGNLIGLLKSISSCQSFTKRLFNEKIGDDWGKDLSGISI